MWLCLFRQGTQEATCGFGVSTYVLFEMVRVMGLLFPRSTHLPCSLTGSGYPYKQCGQQRNSTDTIYAASSSKNNYSQPNRYLKPTPGQVGKNYANPGTHRKCGPLSKLSTICGATHAPTTARCSACTSDPLDSKVGTTI